MWWRSLSRVVLVAAVLSQGCGGGVQVADEVRSGTALISFPDSDGTPVLRVDVADTDAERSQGLMGVKTLPADEGMAFLYDAPSTGRFWMKETVIPLSIAFWDEDGRIVGTADMRPCRDRDPCPTYGAPSPYVGAVEANLGWFDRHGVAVGDQVVVEGCCSS